MVKRIVGWVVLVPFCAALVLFALANRHLVTVNFNPFVPAQAETLPGYGVPFFLVLFLVLLTGVILGGVATWLAQGQVRRDKRHWRREADRLAQELEALRRKEAQAPSNRALAEVDDMVDNF